MATRLIDPQGLERPSRTACFSIIALASSDPDQAVARSVGRRFRRPEVPHEDERFRSSQVYGEVGHESAQWAVSTLVPLNKTAGQRRWSNFLIRQLMLGSSVHLPVIE